MPKSSKKHSDSHQDNGQEEPLFEPEPYEYTWHEFGYGTSTLDDILANEVRERTIFDPDKTQQRFPDGFIFHHFEHPDYLGVIEEDLEYDSIPFEIAKEFEESDLEDSDNNDDEPSQSRI